MLDLTLHFQLSGMERGRLLIAAAQVLRLKTEEIAKLDVIDNGKPIWEARMDMDTVINALEYYGGLAPAYNGTVELNYNLPLIKSRPGRSKYK